MKTQSKTDVLTKGDLDKIANLLDEQFDERLKPFVKEEIDGLKVYVNEGFETVMAGIEGLSAQMAEKEKVERLVKWAKEAGQKIGVRIDI